MLGGSLTAVIIALLLVVTACGSPSRPELVADGSDRGVGRSFDRDEAFPDQVNPAIGYRAGVAPAQRSAIEVRTAGASSTRATAAEVAGPELGSDVPLVVFDTDMGPDIDDALALAALHAYQDRGQAEIAGVTISRNSVIGARFVDAINTWYGHPDIPLGLDRRSPYTLDERSSFVSLADRWPNDAGDQAIADGVTVLRRVLATSIAEGRRPIIVQVGFSGNTAALLDSGPDDISPLTGPELVVESGALLSIMAGSINNPRIEFNVANDVASARRVIGAWPGDMLLSPFELGWDIHYPYAAIRSRLPGSDANPIRAAYEYRDYDWHVDAPPLYDMRTWDITAVMAAIEPDAGWFPVSDWGTVTIDGQGRTGFAPGQGRHRILDRSALSGAALSRAQAEMIELVSAPPG